MVDMTKHRSPDAIEKTISIPSIEAVKEFVNIAAEYTCDATIENGRYAIDAKSILGVFSLDVTKPLTLVLETPSRIYNNKVDDRNDFIEAIRKFIVDDEPVKAENVNTYNVLNHKKVIITKDALEQIQEVLS